MIIFPGGMFDWLKTPDNIDKEASIQARVFTTGLAKKDFLKAARKFNDHPSAQNFAELVWLALIRQQVHS